MEFKVLGPLTVLDGGQVVAIPTIMVRRVLALLLSAGGRPISADTLAEELWRGNTPRSARKTLQVYMHRLRRILGDHDLVTHDLAGYTLRVGSHELDAKAFADLVAEALQAREHRQLDRASDLFQQACALWRGEAYAEFRDLGPVGAEADRLAEARLSALEERFEIDLELGRHSVLIGELSVAVAANPYSERLRGQLMLALYRGGRQADALLAYRRAREVLVTELGVEPLPKLQQLHQKILVNDPELAAPGRAEGNKIPHLLPHDVPDFTGRVSDMTWLDSAAESREAAIVINAIGGTAGVGKTALAVHWAHAAAAAFPDGQLYVNLRGYDRAAPMSSLDALGHVLRSLAVPANQLPVDVDDASAMYRSMVHGRRMVILLDNARSAEQVRPLLPGHSACLVVVTSRDSLSGLVAHDGVRRLTLGVLSESEALELLGKVIGPQRVTAEPETALRLVNLCARLPLALRIAAVQLVDRPSLTLAGYLTDIGHSGVVDRLAIEGDEHYAVRAVLDRSYDALPDVTQRLFRLLGANPGPDFTAESVAVLADLTPEAVKSILDSLTGAHLVERDPKGRYTFHDLVRDYARSRLSSAGDSVAAPIDRLLSYLRRGAIKASSFIATSNPGVDGSAADSPATPAMSSAAEAMTWLETERANLVAAVSCAAEAGKPEVAAGIANPLWQFFHFAGHTSDWITTFECTLAAVESLGDEPTRCHILNALGNAYIKAGRYDLAIKVHEDAVEGWTRMGDVIGAARSKRNLALSFERQGRYTEAIRELEIARITFRDNGERLMEAMILGSGLTGMQNATGQSDRARDGLLEALAIVREIGKPSELVVILSNLGETYQLLGDPTTALSYLEEALALATAVGDRHSEALVLGASADAYRTMGDYARAIEVRIQAHELICQAGMRGDVCSSFNQLALAYSEARQPELARQAYEQALESALELGEGYQEARARAGIGELIKHTDPTTARELLTVALAVFEPISEVDAQKVRESLRTLTAS